MKEIQRRLARLEAPRVRWHDEDVDLAALAALPAAEMADAMRSLTDEQLESIIEQADAICGI